MIDEMKKSIDVNKRKQFIKFYKRYKSISMQMQYPRIIDSDNSLSELIKEFNTEFDKLSLDSALYHLISINGIRKLSETHNYHVLNQLNSSVKNLNNCKKHIENPTQEQQFAYIITDSYIKSFQLYDDNKKELIVKKFNLCNFFL